MVVPLDQIADAGAPRSEDPKLITRVITFELTKPIRRRYINVTDRRTNGQLTVAIPRDAYNASASRSKNCANYYLATIYLVLAYISEMRERIMCKLKETFLLFLFVVFCVFVLCVFLFIIYFFLLVPLVL